MNYDALPKKRMGAGALIFNQQRELLIVNPTYREGWLIPGGVIEENESPRSGCQREIKEELGLDLELLRLLCIDYTRRDQSQTESLQFIFDGGTLAEGVTLLLDPKEHSEFQFVLPEQALQMLNERLARRVKAALSALESKQTLYLENQIAI
jgi:8-oxo-dGTP diphosphatase